MRQQRKKSILPLVKIQLFVSGVIAFMMDTMGVGSFAVSIALAQLFKTFKDDELPAVLNTIQVLPGLLEALLFLKLVKVDAITLLVLIIATCLGGMIGVYKVTKLNQQSIRFLMILCFPIIIILLISEHFHLLPIGGELTSLRGLPLCLGFCGLLIAGMLTAAGIGLFAITQVILFLLGMSPIVAFPIMTAAAAMQQPLCSYFFIKRKDIPIRKCIWLSIGGVIGVAFAIPFIAALEIRYLRILLIVVLSYNTYRIFRSFQSQRKKQLVMASHEAKLNVPKIT
jgi:uncharacterized membrane protein YfcA